MTNIVAKTISSLDRILDNKQVEVIKSCLPALKVEYNALNQDFCSEYVLCDKDYPTNDSKYYQSIRELNNRLYRSLDAALNYQEIEIEIEELEYAVSNSNNDFEKRKKNIEINKKRLRLMAVESEIKSLFKNIEIWKGLSEMYWHDGLKDYGAARQEEMEEKKNILIAMQEQYGLRLSESNIGLFLKRQK